MIAKIHYHCSARVLTLALLGLGLWAGLGTIQAEDKLEVPPVFSQAEPKSVEDLEAMQDHLAKVAEKVKPCVVSIQIGAAFGSGVIIDKEGHILTAGHVSGKADQECTLIFHDGKKAKGKTLGANHQIDSGLIQLTDKREWPFAEMAKSNSVKVNQWVFVSAHPGGYKSGRPPVVRLGRVLTVTRNVISTNCTMVGGDSGGPLFDMQGRVIGINSRIGRTLNSNMHVPISTFHDTWARLEKGEVWGGQSGDVARRGGGGGGGGRAVAGTAFLGAAFDPNGSDLAIAQIQPGSPAEKAGLKVEDVIVSANGQKIETAKDIIGLIGSKKPSDTLNLEVKRGDETVKVKVVLGKRDGAGARGQPALPSAYLGVGLDPGEDGAVVGQVAPDSPAEKAGLKVGDVLVSADGKKFDKANDFAEFMQTKKAGDTLKLEIKRDGETQKIKVVLAKRPQ